MLLEIILMYIKTLQQKRKCCAIFLSRLYTVLISFKYIKEALKSIILQTMKNANDTVIITYQFVKETRIYRVPFQENNKS